MFAQVKVFGLLVKGLRIAVDLLVQLQKEGNIMSALSKVLKLPILSGCSGVDKLLTQFEAAIDSDFPNYEVCNYLFGKCCFLVNSSLLFFQYNVHFFV